MKLLKALVPAAVLLLSACAASGPSYNDVQARIPVLKADAGRIYFYRVAEFAGGAVRPSIKINGEAVGDSVPGGFFYVDRAPGQYEVSTATETTSKIAFKLDPGQERYVRTSVSLGVFVGHVHPELVYPDQGIADLSQCKYIGADAEAIEASTAGKPVVAKAAQK